MLRSYLCNYSDFYTDVKETITVEGTADGNERNKKLIFKNNSPFSSCISKNNNTLTENAEDLDIIWAMYNLLE